MKQDWDAMSTSTGSIRRRRSPRVSFICFRCTNRTHRRRVTNDIIFESLGFPDATFLGGVLRAKAPQPSINVAIIAVAH